MPAPSLISSCTKGCIKNVRNLFDVGDFEYWKIRTILKRVESPQQLHEIELKSPQIKGEDAELWQAFIERDIPNWKDKNYAPKNPTKWYEIYCKYQRELKKKLEKDEEGLKASMAELFQKKATNVSRIVELRKLPKVPRDPRMMANNGGVPIGRGRETGVMKPSASSLIWTSGSKTKLTDGKSVMTKARREAREIFQRGRLSRPTHQRHGKVGQVKQAPAGMVNGYRRERLPTHTVKIPSNNGNMPRRFDVNAGRRILNEREKRLLAFTMPRGQASGAAGATLVSSEDDADDLEDLFDEKPTRTIPPASDISSLAALSPSTFSKTSTIRSQISQPPTPSSSSSVSSSNSAPRPKPSDIISSMISKPKPRPRLSPQTPPTLSSSTTAGFPRSPSPSHGERNRMMIKKRPPPDIFNRAAIKKPRARQLDF